MSAQKPIKAFKHKHATRAAIPSHEEAGAEAASPKVSGGPQRAAIPRNPVVHRGQDPELFWMHKYGEDDTQDRTEVDIRSLYRHEHIEPEKLIKSLARVVRTDERQGDLFGNDADFFSQTFGAEDELTKAQDYYYKHHGWTNRLIQGDSKLVMASLLEREGLAGSVQCIYIDPPYGIKYGSNWQIRLNNRTVTDGQDDSLSGEPEQIKAFRDTWELGIHSYLSYLRDRLLLAKDLLTPSGSCFVQISDENVHLVRCLMDEVFGSENFVATIIVSKTSSGTADNLAVTADYLLWCAREVGSLKFRQPYISKALADGSAEFYDRVELPDGTRRPMSAAEKREIRLIPEGARVYRLDNLCSQSVGREKGEGAACWFPVEIDGRSYLPNAKLRWKTNESGMARLKDVGRLEPRENSLSYVRYLDDFPVIAVSNVWDDLRWGYDASEKLYVVQTNQRVVQRCILMTTDPGDLVLDPTCGSGTTAYVAEQWGRRWMTVDTSRIALNLAKQRLMTARFPYYRLHDSQGSDIRQGFVYKKVPHVTLGSIAKGEPAAEETLYDQPEEDKKRLRISGPFTVETLQAYEPVSPSALAAARKEDPDLERFEGVVFEHLKSAGVKTGDKRENAVFHRIDRLADSSLHAEGFYKTADGEKKAYLHIGPKFGTISKQAVNSAVKAARRKGDADWLLLLGFSFESDIENAQATTSTGSFQVTKVRMHDDLLQEGLLKRDRKAASFVTIGEPDIKLHRTGESAEVEIRGLDIYDPIKDEVKSRDIHDIAYWMVDTDYDGANFIVRQAFFCGGEKDEFDAWKKGLADLGKLGAKKKAEKTLRIEIDEEAFSRLYGHKSLPFPVRPGQVVAVRVISQFGEETTKLLTVGKG